jgi:hypothetical protein
MTVQETIFRENDIGLVESFTGGSVLTPTRATMPGNSRLISAGAGI